MLHDDLRKFQKQSSAALKELGGKTPDISRMLLEFAKEDLPPPQSDGLIAVFASYAGFSDKYKSAVEKHEMEMKSFRESIEEVSRAHSRNLMIAISDMGTASQSDQIDEMIRISALKKSLDELPAKAEDIQNQLNVISLYPLLSAPIAINGAWSAALGDKDGAKKAKRVLVAAAESMMSNIPVLPIFFKPILELFKVTLGRRADSLNTMIGSARNLGALYAVQAMTEQALDDMENGWVNLVATIEAELTTLDSWKIGAQS